MSLKRCYYCYKCGRSMFGWRRTCDAFLPQPQRVCGARQPLIHWFLRRLEFGDEA